MPRIDFHHDAEKEDDDRSCSLLEMSLQRNIPHMHACGGQGRCSTCRVEVFEGLDNVLPRNPVEAELAKQKGLEDNIRLACQTRIRGDVSVRRLVLDEEDAELAMAQQGSTSGREQPLAILFSDIRSFTTFSGRHLPYDIVHILNRYFHLMGNAVLNHQGHIDKYIGDGLMALFGVTESNARSACLNAVTTALQMIEELEKLNRYLKKNFGETFEIGIGIHFGEVVLGELGHPNNRHFTAIGDAVNVASRVESATKEAATPILISHCAYAQIKDDIEIQGELETLLKGKQENYRLYEVAGLKGNDDGIKLTRNNN